MKVRELINSVDRTELYKELDKRDTSYILDPPLFDMIMDNIDDVYETDRENSWKLNASNWYDGIALSLQFQNSDWDNFNPEYESWGETLNAELNKSELEGHTDAELAAEIIAQITKYGTDWLEQNSEVERLFEEEEDQEQTAL